jgi:hypothetical protein
METKTKIPISGNQLAAKWGIEPIDIVYVMLNYNLPAMGFMADFYHIDDILEAEDRDQQTDKRLHPEQWDFPLTEVLEIEIKLADLPRYQGTIRGKSLMNRWNMHQSQILGILFQEQLNFVDPFGQIVDSVEMMKMIQQEQLDIADALFMSKEIELFEQNNEDQLSFLNTEPGKKMRPSQIHRERCRELAAILWVEHPELTMEEMAYRDDISRLFDGRTYSPKTIRNWIKDLCRNRAPGRRPRKKEYTP